MSKIENVIYILTNPQYPGYIKIGYASDLKQRIASLNTGALVEFVPYAVYETPKDKGDLEIHRIIELLNPILRASKFSNGKTKLKEFFKLEPEEAYELLEHIAIVSGTEKSLYKIDVNFNRVPTPKPGSLTSPPVQQKQVIPPHSNPAPIPDGIYHTKRKIKAAGITVAGTMEVKNGNIIVKAGSVISPIEGKGLNQNIHDIRKTLKINNNILTEDVPCVSLNIAAGIVLGASANAWTEWLTENNEPIKIFQKQGGDMNA